MVLLQSKFILDKSMEDVTEIINTFLLSKQYRINGGCVAVESRYLLIGTLYKRKETDMAQKDTGRINLGC